MLLKLWAKHFLFVADSFKRLESSHVCVGQLFTWLQKIRREFWTVWKRGIFIWHFGLSLPKYIHAHGSAEEYFWCDKSDLSTISLHIRHCRFKVCIKMYSFSILWFDFRDFLTLSGHFVLLFGQLSGIYRRPALFLFCLFDGTSVAEYPWENNKQQDTLYSLDSISDMTTECPQLCIQHLLRERTKYPPNVVANGGRKLYAWFLQLCITLQVSYESPVRVWHS